MYACLRFNSLIVGGVLLLESSLLAQDALTTDDRD